jgi:hypothetical protein
VSARLRARATARADGLDKVRALQRVLYRSAKQQPQRRFYALFDKVARSDILCRAWDEVRSNRGAPGVDGVTIAHVEASGVATFLDELAAALNAGVYRPAPLRRVHIPKAGQPGTTRPLGIPTVRDRVVMAAARLVLEPVFEADFLPSSYGFGPSARPTRPLRPSGSRPTTAATGCWMPTCAIAWECHHTTPSLLMPSPGSPNTVSTPQSTSRSTNSSDAILFTTSLLRSPSANLGLGDSISLPDNIVSRGFPMRGSGNVVARRSEYEYLLAFGSPSDGSAAGARNRRPRPA